jgi:hypothetical protein
MNIGRVQGEERLMRILCRRFSDSANAHLGVRCVLVLVILALLGTAVLWGQILSKEYIRLNGRTLAVEVMPPTVTMLNVAPGGSYPSTTQQTISFRVDSALGIIGVNFILDNVWNGEDACDISYEPPYNEFDFYDSQGNLHIYTLGPSANPPTASNNACTINLANSSVTVTPTSVTMNLAITLQPSSVGTQNVYISGVDNSWNFSLNDGVPRASWTAFNEITTAPPTYTLLNTLTTSNSQTLYFKLSDGNGYRYIDQTAEVMMGYDAVGVGGVCTFWFRPAVGNVSLDSYSNGIDTNIGYGSFGQAWSPPYSGHPCSVDLVNSKLHTNPNPSLPDPDPNASLVTDMYLDLVVSLDASLAHPLGVYSSDIDREGRGVFASHTFGGTSAFQVGTWP